MKYKFAIAVIGLVLISAALVYFLNANNSPTNMEIKLNTSKGQVTLSVEIADSDGERAQGLMHRKTLEDGKGMLFIFPNSEPRNFWMKNTLIPLDILFFDSGKKVVKTIENMAPCRTANCPFYFSAAPAMYALELSAGSIKKYSVKKGDELII